ncbi:TPA: RAQPRD family plasmid, partial [Pseudomonas aeruginosa]|nr:RAQPRD family plasmid [Pseudomonas aeruginosa]
IGDYRTERIVPPSPPTTTEGKP